jgi:hypothetical protein
MKRLGVLFIVGVWSVARLGAVSMEDVRRADYRRELDLSRGILARSESVTAEKRADQLQQGKESIDSQGRRVRFDDFITRPRADQVQHHFLTFREGRRDEASILRTFNQSLPSDWWSAVAPFTPWAQVALPAAAAIPGYYMTDEVFSMTNGIDRFDQSRHGGGWYDDGGVSSGRYHYYFQTYDITLNGRMKFQAAYKGTGHPGTGSYDYFVPDTNGVMTKETMSNIAIWPNLSSLDMPREFSVGFADGTNYAMHFDYLSEPDRKIPWETGHWPIDMPASYQYAESVMTSSEFNGRTIELFGRASPILPSMFSLGFPQIFITGLVYP